MIHAAAVLIATLGLLVAESNLRAERVVREPPTPLTAYCKLCEDIYLSMNEYWDSMARYIYPWYDGSPGTSVPSSTTGAPGPDTTIETIDMTKPLQPPGSPSKVIQKLHDDTECNTV